MKSKYGLLAAGLLAVLPVAGAADASLSERFYNAIRNDDRAAVERLLAAGAEVNTRDGRGATPLMYAAAAGTPAMMRQLLAAGADVSARTAFDATALMWCAGDPDKARLLLEKGADVNARSKRGRTPLLIAAMQGTGAEAVRLLLEKGADWRAEVNRPLLAAAAAANNAATVRLLLDKGADPNAASEPGGFTPLMWAAGHGNVDLVTRLIAAGAKVNAQSAVSFGPPVKNGAIAIGKLSALHLAAGAGSLPVVQLLLKAGADVNARDVRGMTPVMLAVATDHPNENAIRALLARRPDLSVKSDAGETALAWAAKFQQPAVLPAIKAGSGGADAPVVTRAAAARGEPRDARAAAEKALSLLQTSAGTFLKQGGCMSCHSHNILTMATAVARSRGVPYDHAAAAEVARGTRAQFAGFADAALERLDPPAVEILQYALLALGMDGAEPDRTTDSIAHNVAAQQAPDGSWGLGGIMRPPITDGRFSQTAMGIYVLRQYGPPALKPEMEQRIRKAARWLVAAEARTTEDAVMQLLGAKWAGLEERVTRRFAERLQQLQREDGGWAQTPFLKSDAYATGTALFALRQAGGLSAADAGWRKGIRYLLESQAGDGSWHVASRAPKFQPYFEGGFPYGHDQWISQMATGWASMVLSFSAPEVRAAR